MPAAGGGRRCAKPADLEFFNGLGGFDKDGREYVTILDAGQYDAGARGST